MRSAGTICVQHEAWHAVASAGREQPKSATCGCCTQREVRELCVGRGGNKGGLDPVRPTLNNGLSNGAPWRANVLCGRALHQTVQPGVLLPTQGARPVHIWVPPALGTLRGKNPQMCRHSKQISDSVNLANVRSMPAGQGGRQLSCSGGPSGAEHGGPT